MIFFSDYGFCVCTIAGPDKFEEENYDEVYRRRDQIRTEKRVWGSSMDAAGAIFGLVGIFVFTFILIFLFVVFNNIQVANVADVKQLESHQRLDKLSSLQQPHQIMLDPSFKPNT